MILNTLLKRRRGTTLVALTFAILFFVTISKTFYSNAQKTLGGDLVFAGAVSGKVFQDFNGNGTSDTALTIANDGFGTVGVAIDRGIANVEVRAYNAAGANVTTGSFVVTDAVGNYSLTTTDAGAGPYRIE